MLNAPELEGNTLLTCWVLFFHSVTHCSALLPNTGRDSRGCYALMDSRGCQMS